jgi:hypothetical protein
MRNNTPMEMSFQHEIIDAFKQYDSDLGFTVMADVTLAWLVATIQKELPNLTYWDFIKLMSKTWFDISRAKRKGLI